MDIQQLRQNFHANDDAQLLDIIIKQYTYKGYVPEVRIDGDRIYIKLDNAIFAETKDKFDKSVSLCNNGRYKEAVSLLKDVVKKCPLHVDAFRTLAQAYMMIGDNTKAIDYNIEALRLDAINEWSLILMGNLLSSRRDIDAAMHYYNQVLTYYPNSAMALNNIGGNMLKLNKIDEALEYFKKANTADSTCMNPYYGMALVYKKKGELVNAWDTAFKGMTEAEIRAENPQILAALNSEYFEIASALEKKTNSERIISDLINDIKEKYQEDVIIEKETGMQVCAKLKYNKSSGLKHHVVKYDEKKNHHTHLIVHEFMHLYMMLEASKRGTNLFVVTNEENITAFNRKYMHFFESMEVRFGKKVAEEYKHSLHDSFVLLLMNGPLDLFVEQRMFDNYNELHPLQMLSISELQMLNIKGMDKAIKNPGNFPNDIVIATRILNVLSALQLKDLYGVDFVPKYQASADELQFATRLYEKFKKIYADIDANETYGDEYNFMLEVIDELGFTAFVNTINEKDFNSPSTPDNDTTNPNEDFAKEHPDKAGSAETFYMSIFMTSALSELHKLPIEKVRKIAFEIAMLGMGGIDPQKKSGYKIPSMPDRDFSGSLLIAYYYVSWAIAIPDKLDALHLPYKNAYEQALSLYNAKKK